MILCVFHGILKPSLYHLFASSCGDSKVMRRGSYKGVIELERVLPLDSTTVCGLIGCVATLCKALTLSQESLTSIKEIMETFEEHMCLHRTIVLAKDKPKYNLEIRHNKIHVKQLKSIFERMHLNFPRWAFQKGYIK